MINSSKSLTNVSIKRRNALQAVVGDIGSTRWDIKGLVPKRIKSRVWPHHCKIEIEAKALVVRARANKSVRPKVDVEVERYKYAQ